MSLTENSDQVFLPGGCNRTQNLKFGPYTICDNSRIAFIEAVTYGPRREKACLRGFRQSEFQTGLLSYRD